MQSQGAPPIPSSAIGVLGMAKQKMVARNHHLQLRRATAAAGRKLECEGYGSREAIEGSRTPSCDSTHNSNDIEHSAVGTSTTGRSVGKLGQYFRGSPPISEIDFYNKSLRRNRCALDVVLRFKTMPKSSVTVDNTFEMADQVITFLFKVADHT
ncbi:hypothetical protein Sjap_013009 [Stephania japonica]|uniref:Uncharacterized protein n=1 Tax=Stephania japonica TaxID=461633 RepID=A0AAP0IZ32_9MAGN